MVINSEIILFRFALISVLMVRGNVVRTFLGKSDFYWPLMLLAEQWQCSLYANVLFVQSSVPTMFLHFFCKRTGYKPTGPAFSEFCTPSLSQTQAVCTTERIYGATSEKLRSSDANSGEKRVYTTTVGPLFSRSVARPRGHRAKKAMVYTVFLGKQGKRVNTIGPERRGIHHRASDPEKEKRRVSTVVVYTFFFPETSKKLP